MFKLILILYVFTYIYDIMMIQRGSSSRDMKEFIENQQYREDQLRYQCNLGNFMIEPKKNIYETIYNDMKNYITTNIEENIYPVLYDSPIYCESYNDFIEKSQDKGNINKKLDFKDRYYKLMNNNPIHWELELDDLILEVNHIRI